MPVLFNGDLQKFIVDTIKENKRVDPYNTQNPDWGYLLDASEANPIARLEAFLAIDGASIHRTGRWDSKLGKYPSLHAAVKLDNLAALQFILQKGASIHVWADGSSFKEEVTALHVAAELGNIAAADLLINNGAKTEARDYYQNTTLHSAIRCIKLDMANYLLSKGADITATTHRGHGILHTAIGTGRSNAVQMIIDLANMETTSGSVMSRLDAGEEGTVFEYACSLRLSSSFWTLIMNGLDATSPAGARRMSWNKQQINIVSGTLPTWVETSVGLCFTSHPVLQVLEKSLLGVTFPEALTLPSCSEICSSCKQLAIDRPVEFQLRNERISKWKRKDVSFSFGYLKRCELCRVDLMDLAKWLPDTLVKPAIGTSEDGRYFASEDDFSSLMRAIESLDRTTTGSPAMRKLASYWMLRCIKSHTECGSGRKPVQLPRYLINTGLSSSSDNIHLHESTPGECGYYFTLSYRWGTSPLVTNQQNLLDFKKDIPKSSLPGIIRDAIELTRQLGCCYIWIDALCIVQDDYKHKETEINFMGDIYQNSTLNIAAALDRSNIQQCTLYHTRLEEKREWGYTNRKPNNLLDERGWILQEQVLCSRTLTFSANEIYWTCNGVDASGANPSGKRVVTPQEQGVVSKLQRDVTYRNVNKTLSGILLPRTWETNMFDLWMILVTDYTHRNLTVDSDRLAALAGIGSRLESILDDHLIAGHWRGQLVNSLAWSTNIGSKLNEWGYGEERTSYPFSAVKAIHRKRPVDLNLPTWSWASINVPISYEGRFFQTYHDKGTFVNGSNRSASVVDLVIKHHPSTRDIEGALTLRGSLMNAKATMQQRMTKSGERVSGSHLTPMLFLDAFCDGTCGEHTSPTNHGTVSCRWFPDLSADGISEIYCFQVVDLFCICLVPTRRRTLEFLRVGACDWKFSDGSPSLDELECPEIVSKRLDFILSQKYDGFGDWSKAGYLKKRRRPLSRLETITII